MIVGGYVGGMPIARLYLGERRVYPIASVPEVTISLTPLSAVIPVTGGETDIVLECTTDWIVNIVNSD